MYGDTQKVQEENIPLEELQSSALSRPSCNVIFIFIGKNVI